MYCDSKPAYLKQRGWLAGWLCSSDWQNNEHRLVNEKLEKQDLQTETFYSLANLSVL
jgi:hypothetical protein